MSLEVFKDLDVFSPSLISNIDLSSGSLLRLSTAVLVLLRPQNCALAQNCALSVEQTRVFFLQAVNSLVGERVQKVFKGDMCIFLCLVRWSELLHHIAAPHSGCQSAGKSRLSQTHPIPVESSSHVKVVFSCWLCAENDALGNMLLPMKSFCF